MIPTISSQVAAQALQDLGWQSFMLDEQLKLLSGDDSAAIFCDMPIAALQYTPFPDLFTPLDKIKIQTALSDFTNGRPTVARLQSTKASRLVEIICYPTNQNGDSSQAAYIGFVRPVSEPVSHVFETTLLLEAPHKKSAALLLSQRIATISELNPLLNEIIDRLSQDFGYPYVSILLADAGETTLTLRATSDLKIDPTANDVPKLYVGDQTMIGQAAARGTPLWNSSFSKNDQILSDHLSITPVTEIAVPLMTGKQILGVLDVQSDQADSFEAADLSLLQTVASQLAIAIENLQLFEERDRRIAELATFNQIGMIIAEHRDLDTILSSTVRRIKSLFQVEGVSLLLLEGDELHFVAAAGSEAEELKTFRLQRGQGIAWSVVETQKTIRVDNVKADPRHFGDIDSAIEFSTRSLLAVPIQTPDRTLGVLEAMNRVDGKPFSRDDEATLEFIVSSVAIVIENARLFDQIQRQIDRSTGLLEASHALSTLDLQNILDTIVQHAGDLLEAEHTVVYLADYSSGKMRATAAHSIGDMVNVPTPPFNFDEGTVGWVVKHNQSLRINDVQQDPRFVQVSPQSPLIGNLVAVPLVVKGEVIGALEATHKISEKDFSADDESLLSAFASQAAIAIHNARLYQDKEHQVQALTILTQTSEAITTARGLDRLLNIVLDSTLSIIGAGTGHITLVDEAQNQALYIEAARGLEAEDIEHFNKLGLSQNVGTYGETFRTRDIVEVENSQTDPRVFQPEEMTWQIAESFTCLPLSSGDDFIGLIELHSLPKNDETRSLLRAVADMAAVAIDKARLFEETGQRLAEVSTLYTLAEQTTQVLDLERIIELTVIILKHALGCSNCALFLKEKQGDVEGLWLKASNGWSDSAEHHPEIEYITRLANQLAARAYPTYIEDVTKPTLPDIPAFILPEADPNGGDDLPASQTHSLIIVPLVTKDELLGAFSIGDAKPDAFGHAEGRLLTIAAAQVATAIENIRLYDNLEKRAIELEVALEEVAEANRLKSEFVQNVSHELRTPLTFIASYIELMLEGTLGEVSDTIRDKLEIVAQKSRTITRLVEDIISLQKIEAGNLRLRVASPHELITRARHGAGANAAQYGIDITTFSTPNLPKVHIDLDRIGQVFDNLVANALKFSPSGSKIHITAEQDQAMIKFAVQDEGIGIPGEKLSKIFDRFYQVDGSTTRRYSGAGLGLAIIKQIIEVHGGRITVESKVDQGTTFLFWLPIYDEAGVDDC